ncbi:hypothetical protein GF312_03585 [Candidatus Poribacteria bacterium]|nr:hypothetical protein [Candidatus Poribacteria bacterium]
MKIKTKINISTIILILIISITPAYSQEYVISPGDIISILVWGHKDYTQTIPVRPDGRISYPFLGEAKVDGLTTTELSEKIREKMMDHLVDPQVTVLITQPRMNQVFVLGQVGMPNQFRFDQEKLNLLKALSMAGGILEETADIRNVRITRDNGTHESVDVEKMVLSDDPQQVFVFPGDVVYVPRMEFIGVTGYVLNPGKYRTNGHVNVIKALTMAGGPMQDEANLSRAMIIRQKGQVLNIDIEKETSEKYIMYPGDTLYIPNAYEDRELILLGYVKRPGKYKVKGTINPLEALALAGGIVNTNEANLKKARIIRKDGILQKLDLSVLKNSKTEEMQSLTKIKLYPGDTLEVPQKKKLINWSLALTVVSVVSIIYNMVYNTQN